MQREAEVVSSCGSSTQGNQRRQVRHSSMHESSGLLYSLSASCRFGCFFTLDLAANSSLTFESMALVSSL